MELDRARRAQREQERRDPDAFAGLMMPSNSDESDWEICMPGTEEWDLSWYKRRETRDSRVRDDDVGHAVKRLPQGVLHRLVVCSSRLTSAGLCKVLQIHGEHLRELCLGDCGSGRLEGGDLQTGIDRCANLHVLEMHGLQVRLPSAAKMIQKLMLGKGCILPPVDSFRSLAELQTLKLGDREDEAPSEYLCSIMQACPKLREIQVYGAIQVTNEVLACAIRHTRHLEFFCGARTQMLFRPSVMFPFPDGPREIEGGALHPEALDAFKQSFPGARVFVDDILAEQLEGDGSCTIS